MTPRRLGLAALVLLGCNSNSATPTPPATPRRTDAAAAPRRADIDGGAGSTAANPNAPVPPEAAPPPTGMLFSLRGTSLRRALPILFPQGGPMEVLVQLSRQATPGIGPHNEDIDADAPFAAVQTHEGDATVPPKVFVAWPLRPGMQIASDARALRGWRQVSEGMYAPTSPDAGADATDRCWVGQRRPVGWMLLCGPGAQLADAAEYLRQQANAADNAAVLEFDVRASNFGRMFRSQLDEIERHEPPTTGSATDAIRHSIYEQVRNDARFYLNLGTDIQTLRGAITQDENNLHMRAEMIIARPTTDQTRGLIAGSVERQAPAALLQVLPAGVQAWVLSGFDRERMGSAVGENEINPILAAQAGPELARVLNLMENIGHLSPPGERLDAYSTEDTYTVYRVIRRADAARWVSDLRVAINSVPNTSLPEGGTRRDFAVVLPTPGLTGDQYLRIGRNVHIPPGVQVPPEVRAEIDRSMLLVADNDRVIVVVGRDPVARYQAMSTGARLSATVPANTVMAGHVSPGSLPAFLRGRTLPGLPAARSTEGTDFSIQVERRGEGARAELRADGPIGATQELRQMYMMIQALEEQMQQAQQRAAQGQGQGGPGGPRPPGPPRPQGRPQLDPSMLPEPPRMQLPAPP